jgi:hypothetical protein
MIRHCRFAIVRLDDFGETPNRLTILRMASGFLVLSPQSDAGLSPTSRERAVIATGLNLPLAGESDLRHLLAPTAVIVPKSGLNFPRAGAGSLCAPEPSG